MNKRGVTPLVATLLLISFSVGLGGVVMSWGQSYIEETAEFITAAQTSPTGCGAVSLKLITLGGKKEICLAPLSNAVRVFLENGPKVSIENIQARVMGSDNVDTVSRILAAPLERAGSIKATFTHQPVGSVRQIKFIPTVMVNNQPSYCDSGSVVVDEPIPACTG